MHLRGMNNRGQNVSTSAYDVQDFGLFPEMVRFQEHKLLLLQDSLGENIFRIASLCSGKRTVQALLLYYYASMPQLRHLKPKLACTSLMDDDSYERDGSPPRRGMTPPAIPPLPRLEGCTIDMISERLGTLQRLENESMQKREAIWRGRAHKDALIQNHRKNQDQEWHAVQKKRKERDERVNTYRQGENAAFAAFRYEAENQERVSHPLFVYYFHSTDILKILQSSLKRIKHGREIYEPYPQSGIQDLAPPIEVVQQDTAHTTPTDETHALAHTRAFPHQRRVAGSDTRSRLDRKTQPNTASSARTAAF